VAGIERRATEWQSHLLQVHRKFRA
jgi:hypothetical protein